MFPKGEIPHKRYLLDRKTHLAYRRLMKTLQSSLAYEASDPAQFRLHVINYAHHYGVKAALAAFNLKRSTFFLWQKRYRDSGQRLISLVPRSTKPKHLRYMTTDYRLVAFIKVMRERYGNVGAHIIKPFLDAYAKTLGIKPVGLTTIGKVIRRRHLTFERRVKAKRKTVIHPLRTRKAPKVKEPGYVEADTIEIRLFGKKCYFITFIDVFTRYAYVELIARQTSQYTKEALIRFQALYPFPIHTIQTDNGSEFFKSFHAYVEEGGIKHVFIYPNSPRLNGIVERFNRTIQEECINRSVNFGINQTQFTHELHWFVSWYNQKRPHSALGYQSPVQFIKARVQ